MSSTGYVGSRQWTHPGSPVTCFDWSAARVGGGAAAVVDLDFYGVFDSHSFILSLGIHRKIRSQCGYSCWTVNFSLSLNSLAAQWEISYGLLFWPCYTSSVWHLLHTSHSQLMTLLFISRRKLEVPAKNFLVFPLPNMLIFLHLYSCMTSFLFN